ncbi:MAG: hypothetical protein JWP81_4482 [Ferruginibacter sp.]|nr:hypothetical protein [Ferruginibacter sp.]
MDTKTNIAGNKSLVAVLVERLKTLWNKVIHIGIDDDTTTFDKRRTRLLNGICTWAFLIYFSYVLAYAGHKDSWFIVNDSLIGVFGYSMVIIINHFRKYALACHGFIIFNLFFYLEQAVTGGIVTGVEYIFVPSCVTSVLFFRTPRIILFYFLANLLFFGLAKWSFSHMQPVFNYKGQEQSIFIANHITMFVILFMIVYYFKTENIRQEKLLESKNVSISNEKQKSDKLLLNILPFETAEELKQTGTAKSRSFKMVTVMFTDFKNFTLTSEKLTPEELVSEIHHYFSTFDLIMKKYNIEKIKTIGDAYMCAGGIPEENTTHPFDVVMAALEIQEFMLQKKKEKENANELFFELRLGIHTGPVVAGIVGTTKFSYDIWGDTVNVASRMQSSGQEGKVNISGSTYQLVKDRFTCLYRGKIAAKNKGAVDMYFVEGPIEPPTLA